MSNGTQAKTLTDFLLERIAEDEADARTAGIASGDRGFGDERLESGRAWVTSYHKVVRQRILPDQKKRTVADCGDFGGMSTSPHIARHDPARVLAECAAKRAILEYATGHHTSSPEGMDVVRILASVYADHNDYDPSWAVS